MTKLIVEYTGDYSTGAIVEILDSMRVQAISSKRGIPYIIERGLGHFVVKLENNLAVVELYDGVVLP